MSKLKKTVIIVYSAMLGLILLYIAAVCLTATVSFNQELNDQTVEVYSEYSNPKITATFKTPLFFGQSFKAKANAENVVDTAKVGEYSVSYKTRFLFKAVEIKHNVRVEDREAPKISLDNTIFKINADKMPVTPEMVDIGCEITDNYDVDITERLKKTIDGDMCYYRVTDSSGNTAEEKVRIIYIDNVGPTINLKGDSTVYFPVNGQYKEYGYILSDNLDESIAQRVIINSNVDMSKTGAYIISYRVSDKAGNTDEAERRVVVYGTGYDKRFETVKPNGKVIYLTFDDGPSAYTERLLDTLKEYKLGATFFVTNQSPKYQNMIARMYNEGHSVGVHTLTHKWEIYKSVDSYLADFNEMNAIIKRQTGVATRIFRFPGGTNNTVSKSHSKGIMTTLAKLMPEKGYSYFDWNVSSGDTYLTDPSDIINNLIKQVSKRKNSMVLCHDIKKATVDAMPGFIEYCLKNGYTFRIITTDTEPIRVGPRN